MQMFTGYGVLPLVTNNRSNYYNIKIKAVWLMVA